MAPVLLRDEATGQREKNAETWYHLHTRGTFYTPYFMFGAHVNGKHSICENGTDATRANPRCDIR